jgi:hypothetical protein
MRENRISALKPMLAAEAYDPYSNKSQPLFQTIPGEPGTKIGSVVMKRIEDKRWISPAWEALRRELSQTEIFQGRYPEITTPEGEMLRNLVVFDFVLNIAMGLRAHRFGAHWMMYGHHATEFAHRLRADSRLRSTVAEALGLSLEEFDARAPDALRSAHRLGPFPDSDAISVLEKGSRQ